MVFHEGSLANRLLERDRAPARPRIHVQIKDALCKQLTAGVLWEDTIKDMIKADIDQRCEPAPGKQLTSMMRRISRAPPEDEERVIF